MKLAVRTLPPLIAMGVGLTGCVDPNDIKEIKRNQKNMMEKLEAIEKKAGGGARPTPPQPRRPDPSKVYAFDVGDAATKGPKDAWVTVIEVSDFQ